LEPAQSIRWVDSWVREKRDVEVIYRVRRKITTGRKTAGET
jgi:hypothetical protein